MCNTTLFEHRNCKHTWAVISEPCGPGMGFVTCGTFGSSTAKQPPRLYRTRTRLCPRCERAEGRRYHDPNMVRMVEARGGKVKWGTGPDDHDWGCEIKFGSCVVL